MELQSRNETRSTFFILPYRASFFPSLDGALWEKETQFFHCDDDAHAVVNDRWIGIGIGIGRTFPDTRLRFSDTEIRFSETKLRFLGI